MALAAVVESIDTVPEALRGEYTEKEGKFYLNIEGVDNHHAVGGLKNALKSERDANKALKDLKTKYDALGLTHDEIEALIAKDTESVTKALKQKGDFDGLLKQHQTKWEGERKSLSERAEGAESAARVAIVDASITTGLNKAKATIEGMALLPAILGKRVDLKIVNGKPVHKILNADGEAMAGTASDGFATYDDLIAEAKKSFPSLFEGSGAGGGGTPRKGGGGGGDVIYTQAEFDALDAKGRAAAATKPGFKIVG